LQEVLDPAKREALDTERAIGWAASALVITAAIGVVAKALGVLVTPGVRGILSQSTVELFETASATFAYTLTALLVALVCGASFELARVRRIGAIARGTVVAISGLVVALASPAVVMRLNTPAALALAVVTSLTTIVAGIVAARSIHTRAIGAVLALLAICALFRVIGWEMASIGSGDGASSKVLVDIGRVFATIAVMLHALTTAVAAVWLGTRSKWRGRLLANVAILLAFIVTYFAARNVDAPTSTIEAVLRSSLTEAAGNLVPISLRPLAAFLVPASIFLALVALLQKGQPRPVIAALALALLSHGSFDVPIHALLITAGAQWTMLAMANAPPFPTGIRIEPS
jgi:hypothetical protein